MAKYLDENGVSYFWSKILSKIEQSSSGSGVDINEIRKQWGVGTTLSGLYAYAEGMFTKSLASQSHAEGNHTTASGDQSHAEGNYTTASGDQSHAEGNYTTASGNYSHAEGVETSASGVASHSEGTITRASGNYSHVEGYDSTASGYAAHARGWGTIASAAYQTAVGYYNVEYAGSSTNSKNTNAIFIIGKGTKDSARSNAFRVGETKVYGSTYSSSGADYAEFFEWLDGNPESEDRVGRFVTLDGEKIRFATSEDSFILGIVSGNPSIIGDSHDDQWKGMYMSDIYGRPIYEMVEVPEELDEDGNIIIEAHTESQQKINPDYDNSLVYESRSTRSEWATVGMLGKLVVEDDGTCEVNGYCTPSENGIATISNDRTRYRVMSRIDENHIKVLIL